MAKSKANFPTSIRLSPAAASFVVAFGKRTGWSVTKVIDSLVLLGEASYYGDSKAVRLHCELMRVAVVSRGKILTAEGQAAVARSAVEKAEAAVKGVA